MSLIGEILRTWGGPSAKAHWTGVVALAWSMIGSPVAEGFREGVTPSLNEIGVTIGMSVGAYIVGHLAAWLPTNKST